MFQSILVATDGTDVSNRAATIAAGLAAKLSARLVFVFVTLPYTLAHPMHPAIAPTPADHEKTNLETAHRIFTVVKPIATKAKVACRSVAIEQDQVWRGLLQAARNESCDMICMASHGRAGLTAVLVGSETQKVLTHAHIPVLIVR
jgi:nucleotide-binding universal stress UspA family protein